MLYVCMRIHVSVCCMAVCMGTHVSLCCVHVHTCVFVCACMYLCVVCAYTCVVCMHVSVCCVYMHTRVLCVCVCVCNIYIVLLGRLLTQTPRLLAEDREVTGAAGTRLSRNGPDTASNSHKQAQI